MISVGIDVSKDRSTVCIMKPGGEILALPYEILHTRESVTALVGRINSYNEEVKVILETTGHYHHPIVSLLLSNKIFVTCINALRMSKYCSQNIRKGKTDAIDAVKIAQYGLAYWNELICHTSEDDTYSKLRLYSRQYHQYTSLLIKAKVNLCNILDQTMPGIKALLEDNKGRHKLSDFIKRYWHFGNIIDISLSEFSSDYCEWAKSEGYHYNERKAAEIYALAQNSIPTLPNSQLTKNMVLESIRILHQIEQSRNTIFQQMQFLAHALPEYPVIVAMGGIGNVLATRLIAEIGDIRRFHSKNALVAYAGIDSPPFQSGAFTSQKRHISKRGNKYLRHIGYEAMQSVMRQKPVNDAVYLFIQKKLSEGKSKKSAKIAGLNKFLKIYYARVNEVYKELDA